ncbi:MAG TPA: tetratricopeptide repeat protein [Terriglobales bacterium]|nr:tetratricopeptide repeat protein [Terriglobales bacterium]
MTKKAILITALLLAALVVPRVAKAADGDVGQEPSISSMTVAQLEEQGDQLRGQRNPAEAIRYYQAALKKDPDNSKLYNKIGMAELRLNHLEAAETAFERAVKIDARNDRALNNMGTVAFAQKNYNRAAKYYKKALALDETNAVYHCNLGSAWFEQNKLEHAMDEYARAIELDPEVFTKITQSGSVARIAGSEDNAKYDFMMAKVFAKQGDVDQTLHWLQKAKEDGYGSMKDVYKDEEFTKMRQDPRLTQIVPPPAAGY